MKVTEVKLSIFHIHFKFQQILTKSEKEVTLKYLSKIILNINPFRLIKRPKIQRYKSANINKKIRRETSCSQFKMESNLETKKNILL